MSSLTGKILVNRYRIDTFIGRGGMAEVYKVWDSHLNAVLAIKLLHADLSLDRTFLRRFKREAQTLERLQHPNIVRFYRLEQDDRQAFMVMDFIEGETLKHKIFDANGPMPIAEIVEIMRPLCQALKYAHNEGFVHADVKPGNILIDHNGKVMLSDFGIARMTETATMTMVGAGTPAYMSPEQAVGGVPTRQSDVYALGVLLFEMLTGERPFNGDYATTGGSTSEKVRWEQIYQPTPSPRKFNPAMSSELEKVVFKALAKKPAERYPSALELLNALHIAYRTVESIELQDELLEKDDESTVKAEPFPWHHWSLRYLLLGIIMVGMVLAVVFAFPSLLPEGENTARPTITVTTEATQFTTPAQLEIVSPEPSSIPTDVYTPTAHPVSPALDYRAGVRIANLCGRSVCITDGFSQPIQKIEPPSPSMKIVGSPSWSPDGNQLVMAVDEGVRAYRWVLYIYDFRTGGYTRLTDNTVTRYDASWSPDGKYIVHNRDCILWLISPDATTDIRFGPADKSLCPHNIRWSPDSQYVAWLPSDKSGIGITIVNSNRIVFIEHSFSGLVDLVWDPDGSYLYIWVGDEYYILSSKCLPTECLPDDIRKGDRNISKKISWLSNYYPQWDGKNSQSTNVTPTSISLPDEISDIDPAGNAISMRLVPSGEFMMGNDSGSSDEKPPHLVYLDGFYMDKYEVTNASYQTCVEIGECSKPKSTGRYDNLGYENHPVVYVDWNQAKTYCEWRGGGLPTEPQWEKAARGTDERTYPWGEGINCSKANYSGCVGDTTEVGIYESGVSPYGLYDMGGNVWEWVEDWYDAYPDNTEPNSNYGTTYRVVRGGSWSGIVAVSLRVFDRYWDDPDLNSSSFGFRCVKDVTR